MYICLICKYFIDNIEYLFILGIIVNQGATMKDTEAVEINLEFLGKTIPLQENELIYRDQIREMRDKIIEYSKVNVKEIEKCGKTSIIHHPCFFINGGRGSGKSTVLRALRKSLDVMVIKSNCWRIWIQRNWRIRKTSLSIFLVGCRTNYRNVTGIFWMEKSRIN